MVCSRGFLNSNSSCSGKLLVEICWILLHLICFVYNFLVLISTHHVILVNLESISFTILEHVTESLSLLLGLLVAALVITLGI